MVGKYVLIKQEALPKQEGDFVTLDDDYLEEYNPFDTKNTDVSMVQSLSSPDRTVLLRIILFSRMHSASSNVQNMESLNDNSRTVVNRNEQQQIVDHDEPIQKPPEYPSFVLSKDPKMGFIKDRNVGEKQRDQYLSDQTSIRLDDIIKKWKGDNLTLLIFIVLDVYQGGIRSLLKHPGRIFVEKDNVTQRWNPYEIRITTDSWTQVEGVELKLTAVAIEGAKTHPDVARDIICYLEDTDENELFNASPDSKESRLALVLCQNGDIRWETLVLSNAMVFEREKKKSNAKNTSNVLTNTAAASKRQRSTEIRMQSFFLPYYSAKKICILENIPSERVPLSKTNEEESNHSIMNSSTYINDFSVLFNQNFLTFGGNIHNSVSYPSQTMSSISTNDSQTPMNLTGSETIFIGLSDETHNDRNDPNLNTILNTTGALSNDLFDITAIVHVVAIGGAKFHYNEPRDIICDFEDTDENELSNASPDSDKSR
ncbi:unnamed protein product [Adineta steineri]|uniref:Uncharacterized protein n=1 Tax=Adineta steineri TaxID=433720 RepID=A0A814QSE3_9BILA|nr:unnamed protein product [Adineta steineri]CAF4075794.1 unnamed protein product [Adineta steineri]